MVTRIDLPQWLDEYLFDELGARYCPSHANVTVIDWDHEDLLDYLGTYFPRSYAESVCIFRHFFASHRDWANKTTLSLFDFGCGTGGEIIGFLSALGDCFSCLKFVRIVVLDGNSEALRMLEKIVARCSDCLPFGVDCRIAPIVIDDFYDLTVVDDIIAEQFDLIMSFKAICEFVSKERFEQENAYQYIVDRFLPKLGENGIMLLADITTYSNVSRAWLPEMMDRGLAECAGCRVIQKNEGYNQVFIVSHSRKSEDRSKIAWRIVQKS